MEFITINIDEVKQHIIAYVNDRMRDQIERHTKNINSATSVPELLAIVAGWFVNFRDALYALQYMNILVRETLRDDNDELYDNDVLFRDLQVAYAKAMYGLDNDDASILEI